MNGNDKGSGNQAPGQGADAPPKGAWRPVLMWTAFAATLLITVIIVVQAILLTRGFS